jgi:RNA polymerase sigma factor (sigma-70 family)
LQQKYEGMVISEQVYNDFKRGEIDSLYVNCYASLMGYAARTLTDNYAFMAEDCVQDAIVAAYDRRNQFTSLFHFKSFVFACLHNKCISILRKANSRDHYMKEATTTEDSIIPTIIEQETIDILLAAIEELPERYKAVFEVSFQKGLSNAEAAQALGLTIDGIKKRKARLISLLRDKMKDNPSAMLLLDALVAFSA